MLVFSRRIGEQIQIGEHVTVTVTRVDDGQVRIGIEAPHGIEIVRNELLPNERITGASRHPPQPNRKAN